MPSADSLRTISSSAVGLRWLRDAVGSSMKTRRASPTSARAMATIWRCAMESVLTGRSRSMLTPSLSSMNAPRRLHLAIIDEVRPRAEIAFEGDVLGHCHFREQREVLPDHLDAEFPRPSWRKMLHRLAVEFHDGAGLGRVNAADDLDQGDLPAAVLTGEAKHLTCGDIKRDILQRLNPTKALRNPFKAEKTGPSPGSGLLIHHDSKPCSDGFIAVQATS